MAKEIKIMIAVFFGAALIIGAIYLYVKNEGLQLPSDGTVFAIEEPITVTLGLGQTATALGAHLTPLEVVEDSRCPVDVVCIQMGTVRVKTRIESGLGTSEMIIGMENPVTTEAEEIKLTTVLPANYSSQTIRSSDYRFTFTVTERGPISADVPIQSRSENTIVYGSNTANMELFRAHCEREGGRFDECGSACKPGAEICAQVCVVMCYLTE